MLSSSVLAFRAPAQRSRGGWKCLGCARGPTTTAARAATLVSRDCSPGESGVAGLAAGVTSGQMVGHSERGRSRRVHGERYRQISVAISRRIGRRRCRKRTKVSTFCIGIRCYDDLETSLFNVLRAARPG